MNTQLLINLIRFPETINQENLTDIDKLRNEFPYCSTLQSLYLKGLQNTESIFFEKQLSKASLLASDRSKLYQLCYQKKLLTIIDSVEQRFEVTTIADADPKINEDEINLSRVDVSEVEMIQAEKEEVVIKPLVLEVQRDTQLKTLEADILLEAINNSILQDVDEEIEILEQQEEELKAKEIEDESINQIEKKVIQPEKEKVQGFAKPKKLSDWLTVMIPVSDEKTELLVDVRDTAKKVLVSPKELIDKFLKVENKKITVSKEAITPQQMAKMSLVENEDFVTETLANIYASQGNYLKSIKIYEQLMLTIPEKKVFFASRIRFLKEKMEYEP